MEKNKKYFFSLTLLSIVGILSLSLFLKILFYPGPVFNSSIGVANDAWEIVSSTVSLEGIRGVVGPLKLLELNQILLILPTGIAFSIFGVGDFATLIFPYLSALLAGSLIFYLGSVWHSRSTGILAMFIWLLIPINLFLSSNLLSVAPLILLNTLALALYIHAKRKRAPLFYVFSGAAFWAGFLLNWGFFAGSAIFVAVDLSFKIQRQKRKEILYFAVAGLALYLILMPQIGAHALDLYYQIRFVLENLYLFPLLALAIVFAYANNSSKTPYAPIFWISAKALILIVGANWIASDPLLSEIGMSGYWLDVLVPGSIIIGWMASEKIEERFLVQVVCLVTYSMLILVIVLLGLKIFPSGIITMSRILFGLTLVAFTTVLLFWSSSKRYRRFAFSFFLITFLLGNLSIAHDYWTSYRYPVEDANKIFSSFVPTDDITLFVGGEDLFARIDYMAGFPEGHIAYNELELIIANLDNSNPNTLPSGAHVVFTEEYRINSLGLIPSNWELQDMIGSSDRQLLFLFEVKP